MKVGRLLKYESREVCATRLHEESFASYLAISISAKYLAQTVGGDFIILVEWLVLNGNGSASNRFRAFLLELFCPPYTIRRNLFVSRRIEEIEEENRFWNASIRRKKLFDPRRVPAKFSSNFPGWRRVHMHKSEIPRRLVRLARPIILTVANQIFYRKANINRL